MTADRPPVSGEPNAERGRALVEQAGSIKAALMAHHPDHGGDPRALADVQAYRQLNGGGQHDQHPVSGEPHTEHGKRILREWLALRPDHPPNTALIRDWIIEAEAEASTGAELDVKRLRTAIDTHVAEECPFDACFGQCAEPIADRYARLAEQEGADR